MRVFVFQWREKVARRFSAIFMSILCAGYKNISYFLQGFVLKSWNNKKCWFPLSVVTFEDRGRHQRGCESKVILVAWGIKYSITSGKLLLKLKEKKIL